MLETHGAAVQRFAVKPSVVVLDTNCLMENLENMEALLAAPKLTVLVPITVITELEGLKKGADGRDQAMAAATAALAMLEQQVPSFIICSYLASDRSFWGRSLPTTRPSCSRSPPRATRCAALSSDPKTSTGVG